MFNFQFFRYLFHIKICPNEIKQLYFYFAILFWYLWGYADRIDTGRVHQKINQIQNKPASSTFGQWSSVAHCSRLIYNHDIFEQFRFNFRTSNQEYLDAMCSSFLGAVFTEMLPSHPVWSSRTKVSQLATSMVTIYANLKKSFSVDEKSHYIFTPKHLSDWCLGLVRYIIQVFSQIF